MIQVMAVVVRPSEYIETIHNGRDQGRKPGLKKYRSDASKAVTMQSRIKYVVGPNARRRLTGQVEARPDLTCAMISSLRSSSCDRSERMLRIATNDHMQQSSARRGAAE